MKHTNDDLRQMQSLPLQAKVMMTKRRIQDWYDYWGGQVYLSFSGGKDSTVLLDILQKTSGVYDVPVVFADTGLEYPEVRMFATARADVVLRPEMRFDRVLATYGYPIISKEVSKKISEARRGWPSAMKAFAGKNADGSESKFRQRFKKYAQLIDTDFKVSAQCCDEMKKKPFKKYEKETGRKPILATMACESRLRATAWMRNGCNAFAANRAVSTPMAFWTEQDVLAYIKENDLEIARVYGDVATKDNRLVTTGCQRTGCIFCPFGCHMDKEPRFQRLKETHPKQWAFCIGGGEYNEDGKWEPSKQGLGLGHVFDELNTIYGENFIQYGKD